MVNGLLAGLLAAAIPLAAAQESRPPAGAAGDRAELLKMFDGPGGLGVVQVAAEPPSVSLAAPLFPRYAGLEADLAFEAPGPFSRIEKVAGPAGSPQGVDVPDDLKDAVGAMPAVTAPVMTQVPPAGLIKAPPASLGSRAGYLVITRRAGREVRPLKTADDLRRWTSVAELQRRAFESAVLDRFGSNLIKAFPPR